VKARVLVTVLAAPAVVLVVLTGRVVMTLITVAVVAGIGLLARFGSDPIIPSARKPRPGDETQLAALAPSVRQALLNEGEPADARTP
jgi:hypothetical protein